MYDVESATPERPQRPERPAPPRSNSRTSFMPVLMVLVPLAIFTLGIVAFTGRAGLLIMAAMASVPAFMLLHYLLWGRWLLKSLRNQPQHNPSQRSDEEVPRNEP